jgi:hypothetical protein
MNRSNLYFDASEMRAERGEVGRAQMRRFARFFGCPSDAFACREKGRFVKMDIITQIIEAIKDIIAKFQEFITDLSSGNFLGE